MQVPVSWLDISDTSDTHFDSEDVTERVSVNAPTERSYEFSDLRRHLTLTADDGYGQMT